MRSLITRTKILLFIPWAYLKRTNNGRFIFQIIYIGCRLVWFSYHKTEVQCSAKNGTKSHRTTLQTLLPRFIRHRAITCCKFYYIIFFNLKKLNETSIIILENFFKFYRINLIIFYNNFIKFWNKLLTSLGTNFLLL